MEFAGLAPLPFITLGEPVEAVNYRRYAQEAHEDVATLADVLKQPDRPTAIFAMNDIVATLVLRAVREVGLRVPDDLSLVGFDNHPELAEHVVPTLTTVAQDTWLLAREAARRLLIMLEGEPARATMILIPTRLVIRESTTVPPA
jgi:DNA-binding LacI/PurR family transcriptional regulator